AVWATSSQAHAADHVIRSGETLAGIARRYHTTVEKLTAANHLSDPNFIVAGRRLRVPGRFARPLAVHVVRGGETLGEIAGAAGTTVTRLAKINHLADPNFIVAGQRLRVPHAPGMGEPARSRHPGPVPAPVPRAVVLGALERG